jgi:hypothetical protein
VVTGVNADAPRLAVPVQAAANLKRSVLVAIPFGAVALALVALVGHPLAGVFVFLGLALGALNSWLVQRSVVRFGESGAANKKKKFVLGVVGRLSLVTLVAAVVLYFARLDGLGVLAGLALFQLIMLGGAAVPLLKELRRS